MSKYKNEISQEEFERIDQYLSGQMDIAGRKALEAEMANNIQLRNEVDLQRRLMQAVEIGTLGETASVADKAGSALPERAPFRHWLYAAAAIAVFVLGYLGWQFFKDSSHEPADLYATYFYPDPGLPVTMRADSNVYLFNEGMVAYKEEQYDRALETWNALVRSGGETDTLRFYIAMAYLNTGNLNDASPALETFIADSQSPFHQRALWYMALIQVKEENFPAAVKLLEQVSEFDEAEQLLREIRQKQAIKP